MVDKIHISASKNNTSGDGEMMLSFFIFSDFFLSGKDGGGAERRNGDSRRLYF